jgi:hypothetical protein
VFCPLVVTLDTEVSWLLELPPLADWYELFEMLTFEEFELETFALFDELFVDSGVVVGLAEALTEGETEFVGDGVVRATLACLDGVDKGLVSKNTENANINTRPAPMA